MAFSFVFVSSCNHRFFKNIFFVHNLPKLKCYMEMNDLTHMLIHLHASFDEFLSTVWLICVHKINAYSEPTPDLPFMPKPGRRLQSETWLILIRRRLPWKHYVINSGLPEVLRYGGLSYIVFHGITVCVLGVVKCGLQSTNWLIEHLNPWNVGTVLLATLGIFQEMCS